VDEARRALEVARPPPTKARSNELSAADRASGLEAQRAALEAMERDREGVEPVVRAALAHGTDGVLGVLIDFVRAPEGLAAAVEAYLGPLARALVVRISPPPSACAAGSTRSGAREGDCCSFRSTALPFGGRGTLLTAIEAVGAGAPWVRALLGDVDLVDDDALLGGEGPRLTRSGAARDPHGVVRLGNPSGASGVLERRERLAALTGDAGGRAQLGGQARAARGLALVSVRSNEEALERSRASLREARTSCGAPTPRSPRRWTGRRAWIATATSSRASSRDARRRARAPRSAPRSPARTAWRSRRRSAICARRRSGARHDLESVQEEWEAARAEESRLAVEETRLGGELARLKERLEAAVGRARLGHRARGSAGPRGAVAARRARAGRAPARRGRRSDGRASSASATPRWPSSGVRDERWRRWRSLWRRPKARARGAPGRARDLGPAARARAASARRYRRASTASATGWKASGAGRSSDSIAEASPVAEDPEVLQEELRRLVIALERIGPVNMLAVEEHEEESKRLDFLSEQRDDLVAARNDLRSAIRHINETATELFTTVFERIRENFQDRARAAVRGRRGGHLARRGRGSARGPVEIHASPHGKKTQRIDLLSGGERALTALSLLFAIYLVKPSPFCVLDEVDAPLDENNIGRFIRLLNEFKQETQFVVITHNPRTIEAADWIYGVTMEEPG
jgi:chromosome segregation protein